MEVKIKLDKDLFPKLFEIEEDLESKILFLINIGYQNVFSSQSELGLIDNVNNICRKYKDDILNGIDSKNENIKLRLEEIKSNVKSEELLDTLDKLFGIRNTSSKKGAISEDYVFNLFNEKYKNYSLDETRKVSHSADGELTSPSGLRCLLEIKNYTNSVNKDEVDKFKFDLKFKNIKFGLFISLQTGICFKNSIDYESFEHNNETYHIIYISKLIEDVNKLDCGMLMLENLYKLNFKDNYDIKIKQIKQLIYENLNEIENIIKQTEKLRDEYLSMETVIRSNFDNFYNKFRSYECDMKSKIQKIWNNLFEDLGNIECNFVDCKTSILNNITNKDKCFNILSKLFDLLNKNKVNIIKNDNDIVMFKNKLEIGTIKKMKDKVSVNLENISISLKSNDRKLNSNYEFIDLLVKKL